MNHSGIFFTTRKPEDVFDLLADPQRFAPLLPFFESMALQDATHFSLQIAIAVGQINGHATLAMELGEVLRPSRLEYRGQGIVAGSQLNLILQFQIAPLADATEVSWQGQIALDGMLALMAGHLIEPMGRKNFELMAERLQSELHETAPEPADGLAPADANHADPDSRSDG
jgi:carbon monoxide dehydrogenase subunit G